VAFNPGFALILIPIAFGVALIIVGGKRAIAYLGVGILLTLVAYVAGIIYFDSSCDSGECDLGVILAISWALGAIFAMTVAVVVIETALARRSR
jgi:hypothetical protein